MKSDKRYPTRSAILIGCPGGGKTTFLYGVQQDLQNVSNFLRSQSGGLWYDREIKSLYNAPLHDVQNAIKNTTADYVFVYFSGHGSINTTTQEQMLCLRDQNVPVRLLLSNSSRQLILIDACRDYLPAISGIPEMPPEFDHFTGSPARQLFDDCIRNSPLGKIIVYGTNEGTPSFDGTTGGAFTSALLQIAGTRVTKSIYTPFQIDSLISYTQQLLRKQRNTQIPSVVNVFGKLTVPFAIGIPQSELPIAKLPEQLSPTQETNSSNGVWVALGIGLLILAFAGSKSKK